MLQRITMKELQSLQNNGKIILKNGTNFVKVSNIQKANFIQTKNFIQKENYTNEEKVEDDQPVKTSLNQDLQECKFIWSKRATCALLSAYEARDIEADNTKKIKNFGNV